MRSITSTLKLLKNPALFVLFTLVVTFIIRANDIAPTDGKLLTILTNSGISSQYESILKIAKEQREQIPNYPYTLVTLESIESNIFNFMRDSLTVDEIDELSILFKNPFLSKISKLFFKPIEDEITFKLFIAKHGQKAGAKKVALITQINTLLLSDTALTGFRNPSEEAPLPSTDHNRYILQSLYYKNRMILESELTEFNRRYKDNKLLMKFYKLNQNAVNMFGRFIHGKLVESQKDLIKN